jgi:putative spermidine/putrescine transport system permease protein
VHAVYVLPFALRLIMTGLRAFDFSRWGGRCKPRSERWRPGGGALPIIRPNLVASFTFCFVLSFVNLPLSLFIPMPTATSQS